MDFGTAVHETIELFKSRNPIEGVTIDIAVFLFKKKFQHLFDSNKDKYSERDLIFDPKKQSCPEEYFLNAGENIIRRLDECDELKDSEVLYNEYPLYEDIDRSDGVKIKFKGFIDMVIKTKDVRGKTILYVCDFKTCSFGWDREKRQDRHLHSQLFLYKHFLCKKFKLDPKFVRTAFVLLKKRPPPLEKGSKETITPVEFFPISAGPTSVQRAVDTMNSSISAMVENTAKETWKKNREQCLNMYGDICPYYSTEKCPGKDPSVEARLLELVQKKNKKKEKKEAQVQTNAEKTDALRAKLFGKSNPR